MARKSEQLTVGRRRIAVVLICVALIVVVCQTALAQEHAAKIQEVLALAHKYRQFNGSALVAVVVDPKVFDTYVGEYEIGPGFVMRVFRDGNRL